MQWLQVYYQWLEDWAVLHPLVAGVLVGILLSASTPLLAVAAAPLSPSRAREIGGSWLIYYSAADRQGGYRTGRLKLRYRLWGKSRASLFARDHATFRRLLDDLRQGSYSLTHSWLRISLRNNKNEPGWEIMVRVSPGRDLVRLPWMAGLVLSFRTDEECDPTATRILLSRTELTPSEVAARLGGSLWLEALRYYEESDGPV